MLQENFKIIRFEKNDEKDKELISEVEIISNSKKLFPSELKKEDKKPLNFSLYPHKRTFLILLFI